MTLYIYAENEELRNLLHKQAEKHRPTDSGFDIPMLEGSLRAGILAASDINLGIRVAATQPAAYPCPMPCLLLPRSSISKTSIRLANSIGLIDMGYRGEVIAKVDSSSSIDTWETGTRYFQICQHNFLPWHRVVIVESLECLPSPPDDRGEGGFGSTGK